MEKTAGELKSELQKLAQSIGDGDDIALEDTDRAMQTLRSLEGLKLSSEKDAPADDQLPYEFRCPLSGNLMEDPVIIASGQTYDRGAIKDWLEIGNLICPKTKQHLSHVILKWRIENATVQPTSSSSNAGNVERVGGSPLNAWADKEILLHHLTKLASPLSIDDQKMAVKEIRKQTEQSQRMRSLFAELPEALPQMLKPLLKNTDVDVEEDLITALLNICILESNKKVIAEDLDLIPLIINSLKSQRAVTRIRAAAVLFVLSALESNKSAIGKCGAMKPLIELVYEAHAVLCGNPKESCDLSVVKATELDKIKEHVKGLQAVESRFKQRNEQDKNERNKLMEEKAVLESEKAALEREKSVLEGEKAALEGEKDVLQSEKAVLEGEKAALEGEKAVLQGEKAALSKDKDMCKKSVKDLKVLVVKLKKSPPRWGNRRTMKALHLIASFLIMATFVVSILLGLKAKYDDWVAWTANIGSAIQFVGIILSILMDVGESYECKDLLNFGNGPSWKPRLLVVFGVFNIVGRAVITRYFYKRGRDGKRHLYVLDTGCFGMIADIVPAGIKIWGKADKEEDEEEAVTQN